MTRSLGWVGLLCGSWAVLLPALVQAQPLGTFRWQMQPYCNVLTIHVTQVGGVYTLDGFDDQCAATTVAPLTGTAVLNPNGTIELGINIVASPVAAASHVAVPLNAATLGGPWQDSAGHAGSFVFTPGAGTGGSPRPSSGYIGAIHVNPAQVQLRVTGNCPAGQLVQQINQDGSVVCAAAAALAGDITAVITAAGSGLQGGVDAGAASLKLAATPSGAFDFSNNGGFVAAGQLSVGTIPATGNGARMMWYPAKAAFRAGHASNDEWRDEYIGQFSTGMGTFVVPHGYAAIALGDTVSAGNNSAAIGYQVSAEQDRSLALGTDVAVNPGHTGAIMIGDGSWLGPFPQPSTAANQFTVRAAGGYRLFTSATLASGVTLAPGGSAWASVSDVNMKENFRDLDGAEVLAKIARMPLREWNYKTQDAGIRHVGPTAQDFHAAFGLGEDPLRISTIDADGIALRAIQALEEVTRAYEARIRELEQRIAILRSSAGVPR